MDKKLKEAFETISERIQNMTQEEINDLNEKLKKSTERNSNFQVILPIDSEKGLIIKNAIKELYALNIPNAKYEYDILDNYWVDIKHNISDLISTNDGIAYKTGKVLKNNLIDNGIVNFSFYQEY